MLAAAFGWRATFFCLAALTLAAFALLRYLPGTAVSAIVKASPAPHHGIGRDSAIGVLGVGVFYFGQGCLWPYLELIGLRSGIAQTSVESSLSLSAVSALLGSALVFVAGSRFGRGLPLLASFALTLAALFSINIPEAAVFRVAIAAFTFAWPVFGAYQFAVIAASSRSPRVGALITAATFAGTMLGPLVAGLISDRAGFGGSYGWRQSWTRLRWAVSSRCCGVRNREESPPFVRHRSISPIEPPALMSAGRNDSSTRTIIEVETDAGLTGLGEASYGHAAHIIERDFAPALSGLDPCVGAAALKRYCLPDHFGFRDTFAQGAAGGLGWSRHRTVGSYRRGRRVCRSTNCSVARFENAPNSWHTLTARPRRARAPTQMAAIAIAAVASTGARIFEFKLGVHPRRGRHRDGAGRSRRRSRVRRRLAIDANMGWSYGRCARRILSEVAPLLENAEEPVASLAQMQQLASEFNVNVSAHCADLDTVLAYPRVGVVPTLDAAGGISGVRRLAQVLGACGRRVWLRSHAEAGIGWAAITHLGMSTPELNRPAQSLMDLIAEDLVLGERWDVRQGGVRPPEIPGLGVSLDRTALRACHAAVPGTG